MGAAPSKPPAPPPRAAQTAAPAPPKVTSTTPLPINSVSTCAVKKVELNQINLDLSRKQNEVDTCDPAAAATRKTQSALAESRQFVTGKTAAYNAAYNEYKKQRKYLDGLVTSSEPLKEYENSLKQSTTMLEAQNKKLEQIERRYRRNFLDNDPQSGTSGVPGIVTSDDKIMIVFWIGLVCGVFMASLVLIRAYTGMPNIKLAFMITGAVLATVYLLIANYA